LGSPVIKRTQQVQHRQRSTAINSNGSGHRASVQTLDKKRHCCESLYRERKKGTEQGIGFASSDVLWLFIYFIAWREGAGV
jgi:hypothetical protein